MSPQRRFPDGSDSEKRRAVRSDMSATASELHATENGTSSVERGVLFSILNFVSVLLGQIDTETDFIESLEVPPNGQHQPRTRQATNLRMQIW